MASRKVHDTTPPPPAVVHALRTGKPVPNDALMRWYENDAPQWIRDRHIAPDLAVFIYKSPAPLSWDFLGVLFPRSGK